MTQAADQLTVLVDANGVVYACGMDRGGEWEVRFLAFPDGSILFYSLAPSSLTLTLPHATAFPV